MVTAIDFSQSMFVVSRTKPVIKFGSILNIISLGQDSRCSTTLAQRTGHWSDNSLDLSFNHFLPQAHPTDMSTLSRGDIGIGLHGFTHKWGRDLHGISSHELNCCSIRTSSCQEVS